MYKSFKSGWKKHLDFFFLDLICIEFSFFVAYFLRFDGRYSMWADPVYKDMIFLLLMIHVCIIFVKNAYSGVLRRSNLEELLSVLKYNAVFFAILLITFFAMHESGLYSRIVLFSFIGINTVLMLILRTIYKNAIRRQKTRSDKNKERMLLICNKEQAEELIHQMERYAYADRTICGLALLDESPIGEVIAGIPVVADKDSVLDYALNHIVDEVFISADAKDPNAFMDAFLNMGIAVHLNMRSISPNLPNLKVEEICGYPTLTSSIGVATPFQLVFKRLMDIAGGLVGILIMGVAYIFVAPIIYFQSPGPVFFKQTRVGKSGRKFQIYKFRSMYMDAEERKKELMAQNEMQGLMFKMQNDPRITPIGHFIRKTSIDELPQFINILKGDMSLVGTRPPTVDEYEKYEMHHKSRLAAKPGLTGMWQVSGRSDITDFEDVVKLDNEYIRNWNIWLDIKIILKTVKVVLLGSGSR